MSFAAAEAAGLPGTFRHWDHEGLDAAAVSNPAALPFHDHRRRPGELAGGAATPRRPEVRRPAPDDRPHRPGYRVDGLVASFIAAEHGLASVRRFQLLADGEPIAAAAMTIHDGVAVLGGASTVPAHRGRGAQSRLLTHRLGAARDAGCRLAVATAAVDSPSERNLARAGFTITRREAWQRADRS
jgi:GNAT superfamily N-acetyltransferase